MRAVAIVSLIAFAACQESPPPRTPPSEELKVPPLGSAPPAVAPAPPRTPADEYAAKLARFLSERILLPPIIRPEEEQMLCSVYEVQINRAMVVWHVKREPLKSSGNEFFDNSARHTLERLMDDKTPLPLPPEDVAAQYRGRRIQIAIAGRGATCEK